MRTDGNCVANICINKPKIISYGFIADRLIQTALLVLALTGTINRSGFLIGTAAIAGLESLGLAVIGHQLKICDKKKNALYAAIAAFIMINLLPLITAMGGMNYKACAWSLAGLNIFCLSVFLISHGVKLKFYDDSRVRLRCC